MRISQILGRKKKNNPILLGEPGVGKTAIAEVRASLPMRLPAPGREAGLCRCAPATAMAVCTSRCAACLEAVCHPGPSFCLFHCNVGARVLQGLARAIVTKTNADGSQLPDFLVGKRLLQLDVGLLIAGAKVRRAGALVVMGRVAWACHASRGR